MHLSYICVCNIHDNERPTRCAIHIPNVQVLELLSHVNKRVKGHDNIKLPLLPLLEVYNQENAPPLVRNFSLVYVEMACDRATLEERFEAVSGNESNHLVILQVVLPTIGILRHCLVLTSTMSAQALRMLKGISNRSPQHREMLLRMAMTGMQHLSKMPSAGKYGTEEEFAAR